jgi:hypothetical protein
MNKKSVVAAFSVVLLTAIGFFLVGLFIDINIILKNNITPFSFTLLLLFCGLIIGALVAKRIFLKGVLRSS